MQLDRHILGAALFAVVVILNHKLGLALTPAELCILAAVLGIDQVTALVRALKVSPVEGRPDAP